MISFHGLGRPITFSTTTGCIQTKYCLINTATYYSNATASNRFEFGSAGIFNSILGHFSIKREIYVDTDMGHSIVDGSDDFGTGFTNSAQTLLYIVQRIAVYCQAIVHGYAG